ncbi:CoA transferase [Kineococcus sp. NPDC059986]|uniref:CaiB/BaiF CoA transferase family protein n=1 Tax=Kineococcus sp. NPDC059986 TaxID=3155538 RepID=UPI00344CEDC3
MGSRSDAPPSDVGRRPLEGVLVADFSRVLAGPLATLHLADLGARVVKVERPGAGDETRRWGPPFSPTGTTYFDSVNRNKESVCLDLADPGDRDLARELVRRADVLVGNFRASSSAGFGPDELATLNPRLVTVSITGFGSDGGADRPGYDFVVQALGGLMSITGPPGHPTKVGVALVDVLCGKDATIGILAALARRAVDGRGSHVEVDLLSSLQAGLVNQVQAYLGTGVDPEPLDDAHPSIAPYELLTCADGPVAVACGTDGMFARLVTALGAPTLAQDPRFATNADRVRHRAALRTALEDLLRTTSAAGAETLLVRHGVPAGRVGTIGDGLRLAASLGLEPLLDVVDADGRTVGRQVRSPVRIDGTGPPRRDAPPRLGEHDEAVRHWLSTPTDEETP